MGTAKRERQKTNRQQRLQELAKQARRDKSKRVGLRVGIVIAVVVAAVAAISFLTGGDDDTTASSSTVAPTSTVPKPDVSIPTDEPTELKVTTIAEGTGEPAKDGDSLEVNYVGVRWATGVMFDNSYDRGQPLPVVLGAGGVIDGFDAGLHDVQVGGRYQIDIPADMAYGPDAAEEVAGALLFVVDIVSITPGDASTSSTAVPDTAATATS